MTTKTFDYVELRAFLDSADRMDLTYRRNRTLLFNQLTHALSDDGTVNVPTVLYRGLKSGLCCKQDHFDNNRELGLMTALESIEEIWEESPVPMELGERGSRNQEPNVSRAEKPAVIQSSSVAAGQSASDQEAEGE